MSKKTLSFMVLSGPRSASTWVANWLTGDKTSCVHDPLFQYRYNDLDQIAQDTDKIAGIACTGMWRFPEVLAAHGAKKLILHRRGDEISESLKALGVASDPKQWDAGLAAIEGLHAPWDAVFDPFKAKIIYEYLTGLPFDLERHALLSQMHIEPEFSKVGVSEMAEAFNRTSIAPKILLP